MLQSNDRLGKLLSVFLYNNIVGKYNIDKEFFDG